MAAWGESYSSCSNVTDKTEHAGEIGLRAIEHSSTKYERRKECRIAAKPEYCNNSSVVE